MKIFQMINKFSGRDYAFESTMHTGHEEPLGELTDCGYPFVMLDGKMFATYESPLGSHESPAMRYLVGCGFTPLEAIQYIDCLPYPDEL